MAFCSDRTVDARSAVEAFVVPDDSDFDDILDATTSGRHFFKSPNQVFVVKNLSKATGGFRPSVVCDGFLAQVASKQAGFSLTPLGQDQKLSFKFEPPSPKFKHGAERANCVSYRLQLLHGSQFLCSLRGLPKVIHCRRTARVLEWGTVHMVFSAAADMDTFLGTLKYVEVQEVASCGSHWSTQQQQQYRQHPHQQGHLKHLQEEQGPLRVARGRTGSCAAAPEGAQIVSGCKTPACASGSRSQRVSSSIADEPLASHAP